MKNALACLLLTAAFGAAQTPPRVIQNVFTNQATATASANVRNIGQVGHIVSLRWLDNGGSTCSSADAVNVGLEASFDGTNYFRFGPTVGHPGFLADTPGGRPIDLITADGVYPYVRLNLRAISSDCLLTAVYTGSLYSAASIVATQADTMQYYRAVLAVVGPTSVAAALTGSELVAVYEVALWNPNAANTVTIGSTSGGSCTTSSGAGFVITSLCQNCGLVLPLSNGRPHFTGLEHVGANGGDLCVLLGAATGVDVAIRWRYE